MAFRFPLESVLRLRQNLERKHELLLHEANQKVLAIKSSIEELDCAVRETAKRQSLELHSGISSAELQFNLACRVVLRRSRDELEKKLREAEGSRAACAEGFRRARQQREVVDTLRRQQLQLYLQNETRQNQRLTDDLFLRRRLYLDRG
jgi:flagellar export protein FliJ